MKHIIKVWKYCALEYQDTMMDNGKWVVISGTEGGGRSDAEGGGSIIITLMCLNDKVAPVHLSYRIMLPLGRWNELTIYYV